MMKLKDDWKRTIICLHKFGIEIANKNPDFVNKWIILNYIHIKLKRLLKTRLKYLCLPDKLLRDYVCKFCKVFEDYVDYNACVLVSSKYINSCGWYYICSIMSERKYKVFAIPINELPEDIIYLSESILFNMNKHLGINEKNYLFYFLIPEKEQTQFAKKASVSLINSTLNYSSDLISLLLENYFSHPRFLRRNDTFNIDIKEFGPDYFYTNEFPNLSTLYFNVNSIDDEYNYGKYVVKNESQLVQERNKNSYVPPQVTHQTFYKNTINYENMLNLKKLCPPCLETYLEKLENCVDPFLQSEFTINIKPVFMVQGSQGSGKFTLIRSLAQKKGLHFINANFGEFRTLATAQKEAKIRMIFQNAIKCTPCILMLQNIEVLGLNTESKKDDRALATFSAELKSIFAQELQYPMIVIATSECKQIPVELDVNFIESIFIQNMTKEERYETLTWLLETKAIKFNGDLQLITTKCSDFGFLDLEALVFHATKHCYKSLSEEEKNNCQTSLILCDDHFKYAYEWLQRSFSTEIGAPKVPEVHWEDIGSLVELKQEIIKRIEMSMFMSAEGEKSGILLYGPPGTGKTLLAKAVATEYQFHFLSVKGPELLNMYVGQSEENVRKIFEKARAVAPCIIFFDELDSLAPNRGRSGDSGGVMDRVVSQLLTEMDGIESNRQMIIIGATNRPDLIDPALLRPGRFDKMLYVGMYDDKQSQKGVLKALTRKFRLEKNGEELDELLTFLPMSLTGADLYAICSDAWMAAARKFIQMNEEGLESKDFKEDPILVTLTDFKNALKEFKPSVSEDEMKKYKKLRDELSYNKF